MFTISTEKVEKVVNEPQNPTPARSFVRGVIPNKVVALVLPPPLTKEFGFGRFVELSTAFVALTGVAKIPPKTKDPNTLIPAVCHPIRYSNLGSFEILAVTLLPI